jgi:hypothetical protein
MFTTLVWSQKAAGKEFVQKRGWGGKESKNVLHDVHNLGYFSIED